MVLFNSIKRDARKVWHSHFFVRPSNKRKKDKDVNKQFKCGESVHCYNPFVLFLIVGLLVLFFGRWLHWVSGSIYGSYLSCFKNSKLIDKWTKIAMVCNSYLP